MGNSLEFIEKVVFKKAGKWILEEDGKIKPDLDKNQKNQEKVLYSFVVDGAVMYTGKSVRALNDRIMNYRNCIGEKQYTERRINHKIIETIKNGKDVLVYVLLNNNVNREEKEILSILNFTAGLEDGIIEKLQPEWNEQGVSK